MQEETDIAATKLVFETAEGAQKNVTIRVGIPYQDTEGAWCCSAQMDGYTDEMPHMKGEDSLQALCLGMLLLRRMLQHFKDEGGRVLYEDGVEEFPIHAYFSYMEDG